MSETSSEDATKGNLSERQWWSKLQVTADFKLVNKSGQMYISDTLLVKFMTLEGFSETVNYSPDDTESGPKSDSSHRWLNKQATSISYNITYAKKVSTSPFFWKWKTVVYFLVLEK